MRDRTDIFWPALTIVLASMYFGAWQKSALAGVFMFFGLLALGSIATYK